MVFRVSRSPRNRLAKYFLRKWLYYDRNVELLREAEEINMKILYASLKTLCNKELELLADKYRVENGPPIKDSILAEKMGVSLEAYRQERITIEDKLQNEISNNYYDFKDENHLSRNMSL